MNMFGFWINYLVLRVDDHWSLFLSPGLEERKNGISLWIWVDWGLSNVLPSDSSVYTTDDSLSLFDSLTTDGYLYEQDAISIWFPWEALEAFLGSILKVVIIGVLSLKCTRFTYCQVHMRLPVMTFHGCLAHESHYGRLPSPLSGNTICHIRWDL